MSTKICCVVLNSAPVFILCVSFQDDFILCVMLFSLSYLCNHEEYSLVTTAVQFFIAFSLQHSIGVKS